MATAGAVNVVISTNDPYITLGGGGGSGYILESTYYDYSGACGFPILAPSECKGVDEMEIGGNICHLCGEKTVTKNIHGHLGKKGQWKTGTFVLYECGTSVETSAKGKKLVVIGDDCIQI
jgi:hypothetical protein